MNFQKQRPRTFHLIGNQNKRYFDHEHFMGREVFCDFWDSHDKTPMTIKPKAKDFVIRTPLFGFRKEEIDVTPVGNKLSIDASINDGSDGFMVDEYLLKELHMEDQHETYELPDGLDTNKLKCDYDGNVLKISIPYTL